MISPESREYLEKLRETPPFGTDRFNLDELREGMATRREAPCRSVISRGLGPLRTEAVYLSAKTAGFSRSRSHFSGLVSMYCRTLSRSRSLRMTCS